MEDKGKLTIIVSVDSKSLNEAKDSLSNVVTSTFDQNYKRIESEIKRLQESIEMYSTLEQDYLNQIKKHEEDIRAYTSHKDRGNAIKQVELIELARGSVPTENVVDAGRALNLMNLWNRLKLLLLEGEEALLETWLKQVKKNIASEARNLGSVGDQASDVYRLNTETWHNIEKRLEELQPRMRDLYKEVLLQEDTFEYQTQSSKDAMDGINQKLDGVRNKKTKAIEDLNELKEKLKELEKQGEEFNIDPDKMMDIYRNIRKETELNVNNAIDSNKKLLNITDLTVDELLSLDNKYASLGMGTGTYSDATNNVYEVTKTAASELNNLGIVADGLNLKTADSALIFGYTKEELLGVGSAAKDAAKSTKDLGKNGIKEVADQAKQAEPKLDSLNSTTEGIKDNAETLDKTLKEGKGAITGYGTEAQSTADKGLTDLEGKIEDVDKAASNLDLKEAVKGLNLTGMNEVIPGLPFPTEKINKDVTAVAETFDKTSKNAQRSLDELGAFAADIAAEINDTFADLIFRSLKGDFDNMKDFWKSTLDAMLQTFSQFIATVISNPIRILLDAVLRGDGGAESPDGGGNGKDGVKDGGGNILGGIGAFFGKGFGSFKALFSGTTWTSGLSTIISTVTSALSFVGAVIAAAFTVFSIVTSLLKKSPRLDIDFDSVKTELGRRAAVVNEFLDPEFFSGNIAEISVKRKAGLGVGGDNAIKDLIQEQIELTIESVQAILFELPLEMAKELNAALLATEVDIDTVVAGERLLEFDAKGKKIKEKFETFINGELQAKFFAAIRESFFEPAFRALGVSAEGTEGLIDKFMADMEAAGSREARAEVGAEFIATFGAFVDAFNIVSGNVNDSIGQRVHIEEWEYRLAA